MSSRIPAFRPKTRPEMNQWFGELYASGLLYHPDDPAETIVRIDSTARLFSSEEAAALNQVMTQLFAEFGDGVYEAANRYFEHWMHGTRARMPSAG